MTLQMMRTLIERLYNEGFYEMIFVLLMVHRDRLSSALDYLLLDSIIEGWGQDEGRIVKRLLRHLA